MKTLYLESISGIAGDMFAASFLDAGLVSSEELRQLPEILHLEGVEIKISKVTRAAMQATHIDVLENGHEWQKRFSKASAHQHEHKHVLSHAHSHEEPGHWHVHYRDLKEFLVSSQLPNKTKELALKIFDHLADAESYCHGISKDEISFHEVGTIDSLLDIVMAAHCISKVSPDAIVSSPIKLGRGIITIQHGTHPVPPPGSARLSIGMPIAPVPSAITRENVELSTPTGLAILKAVNPTFSKEWSLGTVLAQGCGAGTMDLGNYPNLFRISVFETNEKDLRDKSNSFLTDSVVEVSTNLDDISPERLGWVCEKLFELGAVDVWQTPSTGKKGRILIILSLLVDDEKWRVCAEFILRHTTAFGLRYRAWDRLKLDRKFETRRSGAGQIQFKVGYDLHGKKIKEKPEFDDVKKSWDFEINEIK